MEAPTLAVFERSDTTLKEHEWKFNVKSDCSPIANQSSKPTSVTQEGTAAAYDPVYLYLYLIPSYWDFFAYQFRGGKYLKGHCTPPHVPIPSLCLPVPHLVPTILKIIQKEMDIRSTAFKIGQ